MQRLRNQHAWDGSEIEALTTLTGKMQRVTQIGSQLPLLYLWNTTPPRSDLEPRLSDSHVDSCANSVWRALFSAVPLWERRNCKVTNWLKCRKRTRKKNRNRRRRRTAELQAKGMQEKEKREKQRMPDGVGSAKGTNKHWNRLFLPGLGIALWGLVTFPFNSCVSQLSVDQISRNFLYF